jgi:transcriptional regulator with XRE-family HTH domain
MDSDSSNTMGNRARSLLAQKLRMLRLVRGWSQERLAVETGLHRTYVSLIERSACNVSLDNLEKIADAFGLSLPELFGAPDPAAFGEKLLAKLKSQQKQRRR